MYSCPTQGWSADDKYSTNSITYDLNGNIKTISQNWNGALADNLTYAYNGNKLIGVNDAVNNSACTNDFEDNGVKLTPVEGNTSTHEYLYDGNGNMIQDKNKNITVTYNFMNLPTKVNFGNDDSIVWTYSCSGTKLRKTVYDNGQAIKTLDYVNGFDYTNGKLDFFYNEQGRVKKLANGSLRYEYNLTDHLGNSRVFFADTNNDGTAEILQESHYYAFGMRIEGLGVNNDNKYLYNGKELTDDFGLNWYEYGWRMYDGQIGRWLCVDPLDQYFSPFIYADNNPVNIIDLNGTWGGDPDPEYKFIGFTEIDGNKYVGVFDLVYPGEEPGSDWWFYGGNNISTAMFYRTPEDVFASARAGLKLAEETADFATFGLNSARKTIINWENSSGYDKVSAVTTLVCPVIGKLSGSARAAKYIENPWNYFQHINKGGSTTANWAAYYWWKQSKNYKIYNLKVDMLKFYNINIYNIQDVERVLDPAGVLKSSYDYGINVITK